MDNIKALVDLTDPIEAMGKEDTREEAGRTWFVMVLKPNEIPVQVFQTLQEFIDTLIYDPRRSGPNRRTSSLISCRNRRKLNVVQETLKTKNVDFIYVRVATAKPLPTAVAKLSGWKIVNEIQILKEVPHLDLKTLESHIHNMDLKNKDEVEAYFAGLGPTPYSDYQKYQKVLEKRFFTNEAKRLKFISDNSNLVEEVKLRNNKNTVFHLAPNETLYTAEGLWGSHGLSNNHLELIDEPEEKLSVLDKASLASSNKRKKQRNDNDDDDDSQQNLNQSKVNDLKRKTRSSRKAQRTKISSYAEENLEQNKRKRKTMKNRTKNKNKTTMVMTSKTGNKKLFLTIDEYNMFKGMDQDDSEVGQKRPLTHEEDEMFNNNLSECDVEEEEETNEGQERIVKKQKLLENISPEEFMATNRGMSKYLADLMKSSNISSLNSNGLKPEREENAEKPIESLPSRNFGNKGFLVGVLNFIISFVPLHLRDQLVDQLEAPSPSQLEIKVALAENAPEGVNNSENPRDNNHRDVIGSDLDSIDQNKQKAEQKIHGEENPDQLEENKEEVQEDKVFQLDKNIDLESEPEAPREENVDQLKDGKEERQEGKASQASYATSKTVVDMPNAEWSENSAAANPKKTAENLDAKNDNGVINQHLASDHNDVDSVDESKKEAHLPQLLSDKNHDQEPAMNQELATSDLELIEINIQDVAAESDFLSMSNDDPSNKELVQTNDAKSIAQNRKEAPLLAESLSMNIENPDSVMEEKLIASKVVESLEENTNQAHPVSESFSKNIDNQDSRVNQDLVSTNNTESFEENKQGVHSGAGSFSLNIEKQNLMSSMNVESIEETTQEVQPDLSKGVEIVKNEKSVSSQPFVLIEVQGKEPVKTEKSASSLPIVLIEQEKENTDAGKHHESEHLDEEEDEDEEENEKGTVQAKDISYDAKTTTPIAKKYLRKAVVESSGETESATESANKVGNAMLCKQDIDEREADKKKKLLKRANEKVSAFD